MASICKTKGREAHLATARYILLALICLTLASCSATYRNHGYIPPSEEIATITPGVDTRDTVASSVGRPGVSGILDASGWYYVRSRYRHWAYRAPEEIDRQVLAITFTDAGVVENIELFGLERGRVIRLSRRVTTENTRGIGFLRQAFGNLGRIDVGELLAGDN